MPCSARSRRNTARAATKGRRRDSGIAAARARSSSGSDSSARGETPLTSKQAKAETTLGFSVVGRETLDDQEVEVLSLRSGSGLVELVKVLNPASKLERYRGGAETKLHHIGFRVADVDSALERVRAAGVQAVDEAPRRGANGERVALLHPKSTGGVMIELCQPGAG